MHQSTSILEAIISVVAPTNCSSSLLIVFFSRKWSRSFTARYSVSWYSSKHSWTSTSQSTSMARMLGVMSGCASMNAVRGKSSWREWRAAVFCKSYHIWPNAIQLTPGNSKQFLFPLRSFLFYIILLSITWTMSVNTWQNKTVYHSFKHWICYEVFLYYTKHVSPVQID